MEILKPKISDNHDNAIFYSGVIAYGLAKNGNTYLLRSDAMSQITDNGKSYMNEEIEKKALTFELNDDNIEELINVDGWLAISKVDGDAFEDHIFGYYDEAIKEFTTFLTNLR